MRPVGYRQAVEAVLGILVLTVGQPAFCLSLDQRTGKHSGHAPDTVSSARSGAKMTGSVSVTLDRRIPRPSPDSGSLFADGFALRPTPGGAIAGHHRPAPVLAEAVTPEQAERWQELRARLFSQALLRSKHAGAEKIQLNPRPIDNPRVNRQADKWDLIGWHDSLGVALEDARRQNKPVFWLMSLGRIDGET